MCSAAHLRQIRLATDSGGHALLAAVPVEICVWWKVSYNQWRFGRFLIRRAESCRVVLADRPSPPKVLEQGWPRRPSWYLARGAEIKGEHIFVSLQPGAFPAGRDCGQHSSQMFRRRHNGAKCCGTDLWARIVNALGGSAKLACCKCRADVQKHLFFVEMNGALEKFSFPSRLCWRCPMLLCFHSK